MNKIVTGCWSVILLIAFSPFLSSAQDSTKSPDKWHIILEPYLMMPNMHGTCGLGTLPDAEVDEDPGDIFSHVQIGAMLYMELYKGPWAISSDFTYMRLGEDIVGKNGILSGEATMKQLGWEVAVLRKLKPWLEAGLALQLNSIGADLDLLINTSGSTQQRSRSLTETWADPSFVARIKTPLSQNHKWLFQFRGNIGGFGIGSDLYWQLQAYFGYRFSKLFLLSAGYRVIGVDYEKGSGEDRFKYDMTTFGPVVRLGFNF